MKALILNSGLGSRMGVLTSEHPKCMTEISPSETILSRQLKLIAGAGIEEVVMTTGYYDGILVNYCHSLDLPLRFTFVRNPVYDKTNYIYSIYCAREELDDDIILMHGDLVFENEVFDRVVSSPVSCMTVSSTMHMRLPTALSVGCAQVLFRLPLPWSSCRRQWFQCCPSADCSSKEGAFYRRTLLRSSFSPWELSLPSSP